MGGVCWNKLETAHLMLIRAKYEPVKGDLEEWEETTLGQEVLKRFDEQNG